MKILLLTFTLFLICRSLPAPGFNDLVLMKPDSIHPFDRIFKAVCQIESGNDSLAFCIDINGLPSVGIAQIQQIRLDDYNRQTGSHYDLIDCFSQRLSKQIFMFYAQGNYESIAKHWNGRGPMTEIYWKKIKALL